MALDNPSYFTIPGGSSTAPGSRHTGRFSLLRRSTMGTAVSTAPLEKDPSERYSLLPVQHGACRRNPVRHLVRSPSLEDPRSHMLALGMPRPSDVAPSHYTKRHARTTSSGRASRVPDTDLFSAESGAAPAGSSGSLDRYYNVLQSGGLPQNRRRHSIGAYFNRKVNTTSLKIEEETSFTRTHVPVQNEVGGRRWRKSTSRCNKSCQTRGPGPCVCRSGTSKTLAMEDILIISSKQSETADLWGTYLKTCFDQIRKNRNKPPFRILRVGLEDMASTVPASPPLEAKLQHAKLEIVIICPAFLDHLVQFPEHGSLLCKHMQSSRVIAMLLGVDEAAVTDQHKTALPTFCKWRRMESVKDRDEKFVGDFLAASMEIISKSVNQQSQNVAEKCQFMLTPKKVNKSQSKVVVLLNDPITREDVVKVSVVRNNHACEVTAVKKRNPYTLVFKIPEDYLAVAMLVGVQVHRNGVDLGTRMLKCESRLYAMDQILRSCDSPLEFMCQALNIAPCDTDKLDEYLSTAFQCNVPANFNLLQSSGLDHLHRGVISKEEYPTLLHFGARFGLERLCWLLVECPGGPLACDVRNTAELTPAEMAEAAGHHHLANVLCGYMKMTELTSAYTFLKGMTEAKRHEGSDALDNVSNEDYLNPRPVNETYQVPPSPRPLPNCPPPPPLGYMPMHSPTCTKSPSVKSLDDGSLTERRTLKNPAETHGSDHSLKKWKDQFGHSQGSQSNGFQDELIEIINDFKNNVFTITEVEKLVEEWKNRNDVQQSFREKQAQLTLMREEYERVQQRHHEEMSKMGRPSPLERIRNFFRGKPKENKDKPKDCSKKVAGRQGADSFYCQRPISSLSLHSCTSSSSGRLSTGSHCSGASLGDSGTHSDAESERKLRASNECSARTREMLDNYDIPPSPVSLMSEKRLGTVFSSSPPYPSFLDEPVCAVVASGSSTPPAPDSFYCNLPAIESTLHGRIHRGLLKTVDEQAEHKDEYVNLPQPPNGTPQPGVLDIRLPDYVNFENGDTLLPIKCT